MTCKDCLSYEVCKQFNSCIPEEFKGIENHCECFKNKADYVKVVRCVKCGFRDDNLITTSQNIDCYMCKRHHSLVLLNDFCSYGERKDT